MAGVYYTVHGVQIKKALFPSLSPPIIPTTALDRFTMQTNNDAAMFELIILRSHILARSNKGRQLTCYQTMGRMLNV